MDYPNPPDCSVVSRLRAWSSISGYTVMIIGLVTLAAWQLDIPLLGAVFPGMRELKVDVALSMLLAGTALLAIKASPRGRPLRLAGQACAIAVIGMSTVFLAAGSNGAVSMAAAVELLLLGLALLLLDVQSGGVSVSQVLALPSLVISLLAFNQFLYGLGTSPQQAATPVMELQSMVVFLLLGSGVLCTYPDRGPMARFTGSGVTGFLLRRLVPFKFAFVIALGWLIAIGQKARLFNTVLGTSMVAVAFTVLMFRALWWGAQWLDRAEASRINAENDLRELNAELERRVSERTAELESINQQLKTEVARRAEAEEAMSRSEEVYRFLFENNPVPLVAYNHKTLRFTAVNEAAAQQYGYSRKEMLCMTIHPLISPDEMQHALEYIETLQASRANLGLWKNFRKDGTVIDVEVIRHVVTLNGVPHSIAMALDVTERCRAEEALQNYAARLRGLSRQLLDVQEAERARIARELHDQIGQTLTAAKLGLQSLRSHAAGAGLGPPLEDSIELVGQVLDQVRNLSLDLRPPLLNEKGLAAALDSHVRSNAERAGLGVRFEADSMPADLPPAVATACFRIAQEALTNVMRHAAARQVSVELRLRGDELHLRIVDDGRGFDPEPARRNALGGRSFGLLSMAERAALAGGRVEIDSAPGRGTTVHAVFPIGTGARQIRENGGGA